MNVRDISYLGDTLTSKHSITMSKDKKAMVRTQSHVINPINLILRSKVHENVVIMNVRDTTSHGDRLKCQIWYANVNSKHVKKPVNLTMMSKVNVVLGS